ncbi:MAG: DUF1428 domain-containing protein [Pseudomonadota bacterium]
MASITGVVAPVKTADKHAFLRHSRVAAEVLREHGALQIVENWGDDVPDGEATSFPFAVDRQSEETVILSWVLWPDRQTAATAMQIFMDDKRMEAVNPPPFDGRRAIVGEFDLLLDMPCKAGGDRPIRYVDAFLAAVPTANRAAYVEHATLSAPVFHDAGALRLVECWGADVPDGELSSMPMAVKKTAEETVVLSWVVWPDRATRETGMTQVFDDPRIQPDANPMPFDGKRLIYGGFETLLHA